MDEQDRDNGYQQATGAECSLVMAGSLMCGLQASQMFANPLVRVLVGLGASAIAAHLIARWFGYDIMGPEARESSSRA